MTQCCITVWYYPFHTLPAVGVTTTCSSTEVPTTKDFPMPLDYCRSVCSAASTTALHTTLNLYFYQPGVYSTSGWSYSYCAIFMPVCLSARPYKVWESWERGNGGSWHVCLFRVSWFVYLLTAKGSKTMPVPSTVEAHLSLHQRDIAKAPQKHGNGKKSGANYEQAKVRHCAGVTVLCVP